MLATLLAPPPTISVLSSGALEGSLTAMRDIPRAASLRFETSQGIVARLAAGEVPDVLIAQTAAVEELIHRGRALESTLQPIGRIGVGVGTAPHAPRPDLSTVDSLKAAILKADSVIISRGASGVLLEKTFRDMAIVDQIAAKLVRQPRGDDVPRRLADSRGNAIGFAMISEIKYGERHGARYVGPLPEAIQVYTSYAAIVMASSQSPDAAKAFVRALGTRAAAHVFAANGWQP